MYTNEPGILPHQRIAPFGFCLQVLLQAGPPQRVDCLDLCVVVFPKDALLVREIEPGVGNHYPNALLTKLSPPIHMKDDEYSEAIFNDNLDRTGFRESCM